MKETGNTTAGYNIRMEGDDAVVRFEGAMDSSSAPGMIAALPGRLSSPASLSLVADLENVTYLDDFGALVLLELRRLARERGGSFRIAGATEKVKEMLLLIDFDSLDKQTGITRKKDPVFVRLGDAAIRIYSEFKQMISFLGSVFISLMYVASHPRSLRTEDTVLCMQRTGVDALPIVGLISFLLGLIMAFMSSVQLQQFGANIYVASLVSLAMTRELGPIMTAIIVAGRSGSAFAAEIGSMQVSEEVDALVTMGFDPVRFLVVPKILAAVLMVPLLTLFSNLFAIAGGLIVGVLMLDLTGGAYIAQTIRTLTLFDVFWGVGKSCIFAFLIAWIGCHRGFRVRGGAASVGQATTSAVVGSIFMIIVTDSLFAVILRYW